MAGLLPPQGALLSAHVSPFPSTASKTVAVTASRMMSITRLLIAALREAKSTSNTHSQHAQHPLQRQAGKPSLALFQVWQRHHGFIQANQCWGKKKLRGNRGRKHKGCRNRPSLVSSVVDDMAVACGRKRKRESHAICDISKKDRHRHFRNTRRLSGEEVWMHEMDFTAGRQFEESRTQKQCCNLNSARAGPHLAGHKHYGQTLHASRLLRTRRQRSPSGGVKGQCSPTLPCFPCKHGRLGIRATNLHE